MNNTRHLLRKFALLLGFAVLGTGANAGNIRGNWDPQFNLTYPNTGFSGTVQFWVPDPCMVTNLANANTQQWVSDGATCSNSGMYLISAVVDLYNWPNTASIISTITFAPPVPIPDPINGVLLEYDAFGVPKVIGLDTAAIGPQPSGAGSLAPDPLYLQLFSGYESSLAGAYLLPQTTCGEIDTYPCPDYSVGARSFAGDVTFTPEPGTIALLLGGLGATFLARRRKVAA